jgi:signal peptidase I
MWKNEYFKTAVAIVLIVAVALVFLFGLEIMLNTRYPALTVESGSMCIPYDENDNFLLSLEHPFDHTLSVGDIIIVQGVNPKDLNTNYPNSDIIVFHDPYDPSTLIVHRIIGSEDVNGTLYFLTKGDGNGNPWPQKPTTGLDPWDGNNPPGVPASMVVGKVVMRIPWLGWVTLFLRDNPWGLPVVVTIIMLLVIIEFISLILREKKPEQQNRTPTATDVFIKPVFDKRSI